MTKLTSTQINCLGEVVKSGITEGFYLAGGTAITIKYGHRFSEDFDFFTFPDIKMNSINVFNKLNLLAKVSLEQFSDCTVIFYFNDIKFSLFEYRYELLDNPFWDNEKRIYLADDKDIASMKIIAVAQRGLKKDFYDLYYLMNLNQWSLSDLREFVLKKYKIFDFDNIALKSLIYFEDAEKSSYPDIDPLWHKVKDFFTNIVKKEL